VSQLPGVVPISIQRCLGGEVLVIAPAFDRLPIVKRFALTAAHFGQTRLTVRWLLAVLLHKPDTNHQLRFVQTARDNSSHTTLLTEANITLGLLAWKPLIRVEVEIDKNGLMVGRAGYLGRWATILKTF